MIDDVMTTRTDPRNGFDQADSSAVAGRRMIQFDGHVSSFAFRVDIAYHPHPHRVDLPTSSSMFSDLTR
jgi:hypothetical protein